MVGLLLGAGIGVGGDADSEVDLEHGTVRFPERMLSKQALVSEVVEE